MNKAIALPSAVAWAAGYLDSTGEIDLRRSKPSAGNLQLSDYYTARVELRTPSADVAHRMHQVFGLGSVSLARATPALWRWTVVSDDACNVLSLIADHLVRQAALGQLIISYHKTRTVHQGKRGVPWEAAAERESIYEAVRRMKTRKPTGGTDED